MLLSPRRVVGVVLVVLALLAAVLLPAGTHASASAPGRGPAAARATYSVEPHALFGAPGHNGITKKIIQNIKHTPAGATIRGVSWSFSDTRVAKTLNAADNRGVHVYVLVGGNSAGYAAVKYLRRYLGDGSKIWISNGAARRARHYRAKGAMHQKSWTFSTTGTSKLVSIVTSANATDSASTAQYNDGYMFVGFEQVYTAIRLTFDQQVKHRTWPSPFKHVKAGPTTEMWFSPWNKPTMRDPVVSRIDALPTNGLRIRATNAAWSGGRGKAIAAALAAKKRAGAVVRVVSSSPFGSDVRQILRGAGIPIHSAYFGSSRYSHSKFMTAEYRAGGKKHYRVWLGSENWGDGARPQDELVVMVGAPHAHRAYVNFFQKLWRL